MTPKFQRYLSPGKIIAETAAPLRLEEDSLGRHAAVCGGTGGGKSMLTRLLCRQITALGAGYTVIDPHGTTVDGVAQDLAAVRHDPGVVHYLRPTSELGFTFDIFAGLPRGGSLTEYEDALVATADRAFASVERSLSTADQEMQRRKKRWFTDFVYVCGYDVNGEHAGFDKMLTVSNPDDPEFDAILDKVRPLAQRTEFGRAVMADMDQLSALRSPHRAQQREKWIESSVNSVRVVLKPNLQRLFRPRGTSINLRSVILNRHIQLLNLKAPNISEEQKTVLGGMFIHYLIHASETIADERPNEDDRVPHYLIVEEAEKCVGQDLMSGLGELRKKKLRIILIFQNLDCMRKGDLDLVSKVFSQCGMILTLAQTDPDDVEYLAKVFGYAGLDFTPLLRREIIPDGYDFVMLPSYSVTKGHSVGVANSVTVSRAKARAQGVTEAESINEMVSRALSHTHTEGDISGMALGTSAADAKGVTMSEGGSTTAQRSQSFSDGETANVTHTVGYANTASGGESVKGTSRNGVRDRTHMTNRSRSDTHASAVGSGTSRVESNGETHGETASHNEGITATHTDGASKTRLHSTSASDAVGVTNNVGKGRSKSRARTVSESEAEALAMGRTITVTENESVTAGYSVAPLARHREEWVESGMLKMSVQDQLAQMMKRIAGLPDRVVLCTVKGMGTPFLLNIHEVRDPYVERRRLAQLRGDTDLPFVPQTRAARSYDLTNFLAQAVATKAYYFVPDQTPFESADEATKLDDRHRSNGSAPFCRENGKTEQSDRVLA